MFDHIALQAKDTAEVDRWHDWLTSNGVDVVGPTDHDGLIYSVYFQDPNGIRLEITTPTDPDWNNHTERGKKDLALWCDGKRAALARGTDLRAAMVDLILANNSRTSGGER